MEGRFDLSAGPNDKNPSTDELAARREAKFYDQPHIRAFLDAVELYLRHNSPLTRGQMAARLLMAEPQGFEPGSPQHPEGNEQL